MARNLQKREAWVAQNIVALEKTINANGRTITKAILKRHKEIVDRHMKSWERKSKSAINAIEDIVGEKKPK